MENSEIINFLVFLFMYLIPSIIAVFRGHRDHNAISMMNFLLGWTVVFWIWAFLWSLTGNVKGANSGA